MNDEGNAAGTEVGPATHVDVVGDVPPSDAHAIIKVKRPLSEAKLKQLADARVKAVEARRAKADQRRGERQRAQSTPIPVPAPPPPAPTPPASPTIRPLPPRQLTFESPVVRWPGFFAPPPQTRQYKIPF